MSKKIFRFKPQSYGDKGELLPKGLQFLKRLPYVCIIEDQRGPRIELRVEVQARQLKKLITQIDQFKTELVIARNQLQKSDAENFHLNQMVYEYGQVTNIEQLKNLESYLEENILKNEELKESIKNIESSAIKSIKELTEIQNLLIREFKISEPESQFHTFFSRKIQHLLKWPPLQGGAPGLRN